MALSCNKENQHKKAKIRSDTSGPQTQLGRLNCSRATPTSSCVVAPSIAVAHAPMRRLVQQGHKQCDQLNTAHYFMPSIKAEVLPGVSLHSLSSTTSSSTLLLYLYHHNAPYAASSFFHGSLCLVLPARRLAMEIIPLHFAFKSLPAKFAFSVGSSASHTFLSALKQFTTGCLLVVDIHIFFNLDTCKDILTGYFAALAVYESYVPVNKNVSWNYIYYWA